MSRSKRQVLLHLVWTTKNRESLIRPGIQRHIYRHLESVCRELECDVLAIGGMPDHVHVLVVFGPAVTLADLVRRLKGSSSHLVNAQLGGAGDFAWQAGYGAFSVSPKHRESVVRYIVHQSEHHTSGTIWPAAEDVPDEVSEASASADTRPQARQR